MRHKTPKFALAVFLIALAGGCGQQKGKTLFTAGPNSGTDVGKAPDSGTYMLYTAASGNPTITVKLDEGDTIGFRKAPDGRIEAVYTVTTVTKQEKTYPLDKGTAQVYWKEQPSK